MQFVPIAPMTTSVSSPLHQGTLGDRAITPCRQGTDPNNNPSARGKKTQRPDNKTRGKGDALRPQKQGRNVGRRNERERNRVKQVNLGFEKLRQHVPNGGKNKKLSKVDTLRSAVEYIAYLQGVLDSPLGPSPAFSLPRTAGEEGRAEAHIESAMDSFVESLVGDASPQEYYQEERPQSYPALEPLLTQTEPRLAPSDSMASPGGFAHPAPSESLPSPGGYSTDGSVGSEHYSEHHSEHYSEPLSPEDRQLLQFASWLTFQSS